MAVCVAIIGKDNSPQLIKCLKPEEELAFQYKLHTSLDVVEERVASQHTSDLRKMYLGLLIATEEHNIYGYATNTKIVFLIIVEVLNSTLRDNDIQTMFRTLHNCYVDVVSNPFYIPGDPLTSKKIQNVVNKILQGPA